MADNGGNNGNVQGNNNGNGPANSQAGVPVGGFTAEQFNTMSAYFQGLNTGAAGRQANQPTAGTGGSTPQFRPRDIGYFDPNPDVPPVEVKDTHNIYHNVFSFTSRLEVKATTMDPSIIRLNLDSCLLGKADDWFTNQLTRLTRSGLRNDPTGITK